MAAVGFLTVSQEGKPQPHSQRSQASEVGACGWSMVAWSPYPPRAGRSEGVGQHFWPQVLLGSDTKDKSPGHLPQSWARRRPQRPAGHRSALLALPHFSASRRLAGLPGPALSEPKSVASASHRSVPSACPRASSTSPARPPSVLWDCSGRAWPPDHHMHHPERCWLP